MPNKNVCFIGQNRTTCEYISRQLNQFFGRYVDITTWCLQLQPPGNAPSDADVFIASSRAVLGKVRHLLPDSKKIMVAHRTINIENLDRLLELKPGIEAIVVGSSEETAQLAIDIINGFGFTHLNLTPYYPQMPAAVDLRIKTAVTMGLSHLVPDHVATIIELGTKGIDLLTFRELIDYLHIPGEVLNEISHYYISALLSLSRRRQKIADGNAMLKREREVILNTIKEAIVAVNHENRIVLFNPGAEAAFDVSESEALGQNAARVIPQVDFLNCLKTARVMSGEIIRIGQQHFIVATNTIKDEARLVKGVVATFRPVKEVQELDTKVRRELKKKGHVAKYTFADIIGASEKLKEAVAYARQFAKTDLTVLLEGESGTGKEVLAQAIHNASSRKQGPFIALNFAALPESLVESELFGYEQGAFSGAQKGGKQGLFEAAHQGTIFLDEIGDASLAVQKKLLRVLEEREVRRVGGSTVTPIDVRVIAATNIDLKSRVESKNFRIDLFYRLNALPIALPPLREMGTDVHLLADWFARKFYRHSLRLSGPLKDFLLDYPWPGNIRELQNVVRYLCNVMAPREVATRRHLPPYLAKSAPGKSVVTPPAGPVAAKNFATVTSGLARRHLQTPVALILREMQQTSALNSGIGRQRLLQRVRETDATMSEHRVRTCMTILERLEFITSGMTRQGSRITREGEAFLSFLESGTLPPASSRPDANDPGLAADRSGAY